MRRSLIAAVVLLSLLFGGGALARGGGQNRTIPVYLVIPAVYSSAVTPDQMAQTISYAMGQPTDAPCIGSHSCSIEAWFRHELGQVFDYRIITVPAPKYDNTSGVPVDSCGRFSSSGLYLGAEDAISSAGYSIDHTRYFMVMMGAGGWAGHFAPSDRKLNMGMVGDWGGEVLFGTSAQDSCNWTTEVIPGMAHEFAGMLGMYETDGYNGALWNGDVMTANNKRDLLHWSGAWLRSP